MSDSSYIKAQYAKQEVFIKKHGFEIGERVQVDGVLYGTIEESLQAQNCVAIKFKADEYYQVYPRLGSYPHVWVMQMIPIDKLTKEE